MNEIEQETFSNDFKQAWYTSNKHFQKQDGDALKSAMPLVNSVQPS